MAADNGRATDDVAGEVRKSAAEGEQLFQNNLDAIMAANNAMIRGFQAFGTEALAFVQSRMKETLETGRRLAACRNPEEAVETQIDFMRGSVQAYADEFKRITEVSGQVFDETLEPLAARAGRREKAAARAA